MTIVTYIGHLETPFPAETVEGNPKTKNTAFLAAITVTATETFESFVTNVSAPLTVLGTGTLALVGAPIVGAVHRTRTTAASGHVGRYNTTGVGSGVAVAGVWWETAQSFTVTFPASHSAFGFYMTDLGDFASGLVIVPQIAGVDQTGVVVPGGGSSGGLDFFGITNDAATYSGFKVTITQAPPADDPDVFDNIGFDDIIMGDVIPPVTGPIDAVLFKSPLAIAATGEVVAVLASWYGGACGVGLRATGELCLVLQGRIPKGIT